MTLAWVGLGANLGDAALALRSAAAALGALAQTVLVALSSVYRSAPIESSGADYLNAVALLQTELPAPALLAELRRIERGHGRERPYRNAPRTLDLDLLVYGDQRIALPTLTVPHPRAHVRAFVLRPLAEIAPELELPGRGRVTELLALVADQRIEKVSVPGWSAGPWSRPPGDG
ncbi:MAG: 2-amino-4-hydroxy-6-hydroxymethyldihydropteridine diphosphokinase [Burkholderiaceae bacterium]